MHNMILTVAGLVGQNPVVAYFIIYVATIFLGNISAFVSFWVIFEIHFGLIGLLCLVLTIFLSDMTGDLLWYSLGRMLRDTRFGLWMETHLPGHAKIEAMLQERGQRWLFLSKFVLGFAPPVVFSIGWSGMEFKTFFKNSILSIVLWLPVLTALAYGIVSGLAPLAASNFRRVEWVFLGGFVLFIILDYVIATGVGTLAKRILGTTGKKDDLTDEAEKHYHQD
jgi:membrane protein DedA with SNARE-associated domain